MGFLKQNGEKMKFDKIIWGLLLIIAGLLWILNNTGFIDINFNHVIRLWPLLLIFWGITILPVRDYLKTIFLILIIAFAVFMIIGKDNNVDFFNKQFRGNPNNPELYEDV